jgi:phage terminase large subunit-like protein
MQSSAQMFGGLADAISGSWRVQARPEQREPPGDWLTWLILAGRGWGKTRTGTEWVHRHAIMGTASRIALVAPTAADVRDVLVEGPSGFLSIASNSTRPTWEPSKRRLEWPNGATATCFSAEEPERLRGPQHDLAYLDELATWPHPEALDMLNLGLRVGIRPRKLITTTPRPSKMLKAIIDDPSTVITRGRTVDNAKNLAPSFISSIMNRYAGTRMGRQEIDGELLLDVQGALWTRDMLDHANGAWKLPDMKRVVVAVDPSGTRGQEDGGDSVGIVVAGLGADGLGYVLADRTCKLSPDGWGRAAVNAYREFKADRIVAERNFGGAMVEHVIRTVDRNVSYREVTASRGKIARAEPIAALYEQNRVRHVGLFAELEDQMAAMTGDGYSGDGSPDRCDALVWALSELMVQAIEATPPRFGTYGSGAGWNGAYYVGGDEHAGWGTTYASKPPEYWAALGIFHPHDKQMWIDRGVWKEPLAEEKPK